MDSTWLFIADEGVKKEIVLSLRKLAVILSDASNSQFHLTERGYDGIVSFISKTQLIRHYEQTLGAKLFRGNRMFIDTKEALILTTQYFKDFKR